MRRDARLLVVLAALVAALAMASLLTGPAGAGPRAGLQALWTGEGPLAALSDREREVAELVAAGRTNREIAGELFLSKRTVDTHLAHVFEKLGVSSRAAVAAAVARQLD